MKREFSCGAVVYTRKNNDILYVIVESLSGFYGFPKGHREKGETEEETALREIKEEVGIKPKLIDGFCKVENYEIHRKGRRLKKVVYFLGEYENQKIEYQKEELKGAYLMKYEDAMKVLQFDRLKEILKSANRKLTIKDVN